MNTDLKSITIYCGNGGDYEFERDRHWWRVWIEQNITQSPFVIKPHKDGDKAILVFEADKWHYIFLLKAPEYMRPELLRHE